MLLVLDTQVLRSTAAATAPAFAQLEARAGQVQERANAKRHDRDHEEDENRSWVHVGERTR